MYLKNGVYKFIRTISDSNLEVYAMINGKTTLLITMEENPKLKRLLKFVELKLVSTKQLDQVLVDYKQAENISHSTFTDMYVRAVNRLNAAVDFHELDLIRKKDASSFISVDAYGFPK